MRFERAIRGVESRAISRDSAFLHLFSVARRGRRARPVRGGEDGGGGGGVGGWVDGGVVQGMSGSVLKGEDWMLSGDDGYVENSMF